MTMDRRNFLARSAGLAAVTAVPTPAKVVRESGVKLRVSLNAFCFDKPLRDGSMTMADVVHFCAQQGIDAMDATGYYFPGYPKVAADEYIYNLKRTAFVNGIAISGVGVRNNFAQADAAARKNDVQMVKDWILVASKLGAPVMRVFAGPVGVPAHSFDETLEWMAADFRECAAFGQQHGVVLAVQQHNDVLKTAADTIRLIDAVGSDWFGCLLDVESLRTGDPYAEIEKLEPYSVTWELKENVVRGTQREPTDLARIKAIMDRAGYRGYLPFESLAGGDPRVKVLSFLDRIRKAFGA